MRWPAAALAAAGLLGATMVAPQAADDLKSLLDGIAGAKQPQGEVAVNGWVERGPGGTELVVRVEPRGAARLVAEPGVTVTPIPRDGVAWPTGSATRDDMGRSYFDGPIELRLPFAAQGRSPVEADVDYSYCLVGYQCLFGAAKVRAAVPAAAAACAMDKPAHAVTAC